MLKINTLITAEAVNALKHSYTSLFCCVAIYELYMDYFCLGYVTFINKTEIK